MDLRGDTLRLGLLPPLRGGRLAWPTPRAWDNPNPALPPYDVQTPHTWSPAYGGYHKDLSSPRAAQRSPRAAAQSSLRALTRNPNQRMHYRQFRAKKPAMRASTRNPSQRSHCRHFKITRQKTISSNRIWAQGGPTTKDTVWAHPQIPRDDWFGTHFETFGPPSPEANQDVLRAARGAQQQTSDSGTPQFMV